MTSFMSDKVYYKFGNRDTEYDAWATSVAASGTAVQKAAALKFSGKTIDFIMSNGWLASWPAPDVSKSFYEYVTKWSGGCLEDYSSGMGGFCVLEDNNTAFYDCGNIDCQYAADASANALACTEAPANCVVPTPATGSDDEKRCAKKLSTPVVYCGNTQGSTFPVPAYNEAAGDGSSGATGAKTKCNLLTGTNQL